MGTQQVNPTDAFRSELIAVLESRRSEIAEALVARLSNTDLGFDQDADFTNWLRLAAPEAVSGMVAALEEGDRWSGTLPPAIVAQIQFAARQGASLESVLRGFSIVGTVFFEFFAKRIGELPYADDALRYTANWQSWNQDLMMNAFAVEYTKEVERLERLPNHQLVKQVKRLLEGGSGEYADLDYRLDACHVGLIAAGAKAELACRSLAERLGSDLLFLPDDDDMAWAWLGAPRQIGFSELESLVDADAGSPSLAAGEPRVGLEGWRLTHREAQAALGVALLEGPGLTRYSDVTLLANALSNEAAGRSLIDRYIEPLDRHRDGERLKTTVRAYLDLDCNAASAASALGVNRHTVQRRLKRVEDAVGEPLSTRRPELDVALRLERLTERKTGDGQVSR